MIAFETVKRRMKMSVHYDVVIVGAGTMGMAAGYYLAKQGTKTLLVDAFDPPHSKGSHSGDTRIIRFAYGEGREYVPLALRSKQLWDDLQKETSDPLFLQTGVLGFGPKGTEFLEEAIESADQYQLPIEVLDTEAINKRWPGMTIPDHYVGCFEPTSGVLFSENCIRTYRDGALKYGATLIPNTPVQDIEVHENFVSVHTKDESYTASKLILSAGAWSGELLSKLGIHVALQPTRQTFGFFEAEQELFDSEQFPIFLTQTPNGTYYGFPSIKGSGLKAGRHDIGQDIPPDYAENQYGMYPEDEAHTRTFLDTYMPKASGKLMNGMTCIYTRTPDEHFIIDLHPKYDHIAIATGFSGHGFKFASGVGEILCELVTHGKTTYNISSFSIKRPALRGEFSKINK